MQDALIKTEQREKSKVEQSDATEDNVAPQQEVNVITKGIHYSNRKGSRSKGVGVESQLCILGRSFAVSILASATTVNKEREEFLRLVNRKITFYNRESSDGDKEAADGERGGGKSYKAAQEANYKQDVEENVSDAVPSGLIDSVNNMLQSLEKQLDDVDSKIGDNWRVLDRDYDGRFSQEVEDAALYLEGTLDNGEIQELVKDLSKDKGFVTMDSEKILENKIDEEEIVEELDDEF